MAWKRDTWVGNPVAQPDKVTAETPSTSAAASLKLRMTTHPLERIIETSRPF
jgi:hypothetical protein